jgi:hypothetical protein
MTRRTWMIVLGIVGGFVVVGHLIGLAFLGMKLGDWVGGTLIGLVIVLVAAAHLAIPAHRGGARTPRRELGLWALALAVGSLAGYLATLVPVGARWWLIVPWVGLVLAFGMAAAGEPRDKAIRLGCFGFASVMVFAASGANMKSASGAVTTVGLAVVGALAAVLVGLLAHVTVNSLQRRPEPVSSETTPGPRGGR